MSVGDIEALGQLATAGLAAHAVDGQDSGEHGHRHYVCRNCGMLLAGKFCTGCGQAGHVHRSIGHIGHELLHGITHLDGKAAKTLPKLLFDPGGLTYEYVHGRRTRYIAPVALFLMCVFLMFFVFGFTGGPQINPGTFANTADAREAANDAADAERETAKDLAEAKADPDTPTAERAGLQAAANATHLARVKAEQAAAGVAVQPTAKRHFVVAPGTNWADAVRDATLRGDIKIKAPTPALTASIRRALLDPEFTLYKIQQKAYKLSFLLVPLSLPWMWLLFVGRRGHTLYDHSVFVLYSLSFMSLMLIAATLLGIAGVESGFVFMLLLVIAPVVHLFMQLKGAYKLSGWSAAWRTVALSFFAGTTLTLFAAAILFVGVLE